MTRVQPPSSQRTLGSNTEFKIRCTADLDSSVRWNDENAGRVGAMPEGDIDAILEGASG